MPVTVPNYTNKSLLEKVFGVRNIAKWADLDNDADPSTIADRIKMMGENATEYINSRLLDNKYSVPFTNVPYIVVHATTLLAGVYLFDGRLVVSSEPNFDQISRPRKQVKMFLKELLSGQLHLLDPLSGLPIPSNCSEAPSTGE